MIDYSLIFQPKQHYITIPQIPQKKLLISNSQIPKILGRQKEGQDIFISKYAKNNVIMCVILDFDDKDNPDNAFSDVVKMKKYLSRKGLNTVIVQSGRKGYHAYIEIPCHNFIGGELAHANAEPNIWFKEYIKRLIGIYDSKYYPTLDEINFSSGLGGNIRLIGSIHPKSGNCCEVVEGEFIGNTEPNDWDWKCFEISKKYAEDKCTIFKPKDANVNIQGHDLIEENDLQEVFPDVFGVNIKRYSDYSYCNCPFHSDKHASMFLDKHKYSCNACGAKGNIWTLIKKGYVKLDDSVRVKS